MSLHFSSLTWSPRLASINSCGCSGFGHCRRRTQGRAVGHVAARVAVVAVSSDGAAVTSQRTTSRPLWARTTLGAG